MPEPTRAGDIIAGKYRVERVIGSGGMGYVVEAHHMTLDEKVAIKFLKPEALENAAAVARFEREARAAAKIKSEHGCRVHDVVTEGGMPFLVMECLEGRDLDDIVEKDGAIGVEDGVDYVLQACEALAEAHVAGIVHRDLKPANLFLARRADGSPVVKVLDFGISKLAPKAGSAEAAMTATSSLLGSPLYMSPEQMRATRDVDLRTDIWSLGVILYEILTADRPFYGDTIPNICAQILSEEPRALAGRVPPALEAVILRCLAKRPEERYQNVAEFAEALRPIAADRSWISIDRIARVIGAKGGAAKGAPPASRPSSTGLPAVVAPPPSAPQVASPTGPAALAPAPPAAAGPVGAGTNAAFVSKVPEGGPRRGWAVAAAIGGLAVVAIAIGFAVTRSPSPVSTPAAAAKAEPPALPAAVPAAPLPSAAPQLTAAPAVSAAPPPATASAPAAPPQTAAAAAAPAAPKPRPASSAKPAAKPAGPTGKEFGGSRD